MCEIFFKYHEWILTGNIGNMVIYFPRSKKVFKSSVSFRIDDYTKALFMKQWAAFILDKFYFFKRPHNKSMLLQLVESSDTIARNYFGKDDLFLNLHCALLNRMLVLDNKKYPDILSKINELNHTRYFGNAHLALAWKKYFEEGNPNAAIAEIEVGIQYRKSIPQWTYGELLVAKGYILIESKLDIIAGLRDLVDGVKVLDNCGVISLSTASYWMERPFNHKDYLKRISVDLDIKQNQLIDLLL